MTPRRIQRRRAKGWKMPEGAVYVGRPTCWGNPWRVCDPEMVGDREHAVATYRSWLTTGAVGTSLLLSFWGFRLHTGLRPDVVKALGSHRGFLLARLPELRGKDLACWCPLVDADGKPVPCHADVLLALANKEAT